ncbi:hypothetical+protein [Methylocapsa aurea]|uniref:hypothetical protein n=1 Tax=Methylocapsa aurea TaxID=663610 RepID=UPI003D18BE5F
MSAFTILSSTSHAVTSTAYTFQPDLGIADPNSLNDPKPWLVRVWSDVNICLRADGQAASQSDFPIAAGREGELINLPPGGSLSVVTQAGQSDGTVFFSHVKRQ